MQLASITLVLLLASTAHADPERKGFVFGAAAGVSLLRYDLVDGTAVKPSAPNLKLGMMVTPNTAVLLVLPGSLYEYRGSGRVRDRGFEGIMLSVQHWVAPRWWVLGGAGVAMDAPAFYDIEDASEREFEFGVGAIAGTGYELWTRGRFALDVQARLHANTVHGQNGLASSLLVGITWH